MPQQLRYLADVHHGVPMDFEKDPDAWKKLLLQMADDFEAHKRFEEKWYEGDLPMNYTQCYKEEMEAWERQKAAFETFKEYFHGLWD